MSKFSEEEDRQFLGATDGNREKQFGVVLKSDGSSGQNQIIRVDLTKFEDMVGGDTDLDLTNIV